MDKYYLILINLIREWVLLSSLGSVIHAVKVSVIYTAAACVAKTCCSCPHSYTYDESGIGFGEQEVLGNRYIGRKWVSPIFVSFNELYIICLHDYTFISGLWAKYSNLFYDFIFSWCEKGNVRHFLTLLCQNVKFILRIYHDVFTIYFSFILPGADVVITRHPSFWPMFERLRALGPKQLHDHWQGQLRLQRYFTEVAIKITSIPR